MALMKAPVSFLFEIHLNPLYNTGQREGSMTTKQLEKEALTLNSIDRIHLVEKLFISLNRPDPELEQEWVRESEARYEAYKNGEIDPVSLQNVRDKHS
jgi:putative addiction module component (TIGR02574 family)